MGNVNFSLEVTTRTNLSDLPKLNDIYITFLPGTSYLDVIEQTKALASAGYNPIPHFPARSITDSDMLKSYICLLYTSPSPRDTLLSRMPSSA